MDAVEFIKARNRMCDNYACCTDCPLGGEENCNEIRNVNAGTIIPIVEQWAKEQPIKTRQSVFLEQFPNVRIGANKIIDICPKTLYGSSVCRKTEFDYKCDPCFVCRSEFWMQEVE